MSDTAPPEPDSRAQSLMTGLCAAAIILVPAVAFMFDGPGKPIENRAPAAYTGLDSGWRSVGSFGQFIADRVPLRANAVRLDAWVDEHVYNEDPAFGGGASARVLRGEQGFLFLADAIENACAPAAPPASSAANLAELARIVKASGRDVVTMVAPDKSSVHPELMPQNFGKRECFDQYTAELWSGLDNARIEGFVDLRTALTRESKATREALYLRKDSHWDSAGSLVAVQAMVDRFAPGLWSDDEVHYQGLGRYTGDLTGMQGQAQEDDAPIYSIVRPDVTSVSVEVIDDIEGGSNRRFINEAPPGRLIPGHTVMFLDSFGLVALPQIVPFFEDLTIIRLVDYEPQKFLLAIAGADRVWILCVERGLAYRMELEIGSRPFLDLLNEQLLPAG